MFSYKKLSIFISKDDKIVFNYFLGKLKMLLNHPGSLDQFCKQNIPRWSWEPLVK